MCAKQHVYAILYNMQKGTPHAEHTLRGCRQAKQFIIGEPIIAASSQDDE